MHHDDNTQSDDLFTCSTCHRTHPGSRLASMDGEPPVCSGCAEQ